MKKLDEFLANTKPGAKKSELHDYLPVLQSLRDKGYTLVQIQMFLKENKVIKSVAWISAFLRSHGERQETVLEKKESGSAEQSEGDVANSKKEVTGRDVVVETFHQKQNTSKYNAD